MAVSPAFAGLSTLVRELRVHLCQRSPSSLGTRDFIDKFYVQLKKQNPQLPILIRECSGVKPKLYARFDYGQETNVSLAEMTSEQVLKALDDLVKAGPK